MPYGLSPRNFARLAYLRVTVNHWLRQLECRWPSHAQPIRYALGKGNRTRPISVLLACEAVGGSWRSARAFALAIELAHKASVIRDDIEDGDDYRRGRPTFHTKYGVPLAVAVSDLLCSAALMEAHSGFAMLPKAAPDHIGLFLKAYFDMSMGQLDDVRGATDLTVSSESPLQVNQLKTGSLSELAFRTGATVGGGTPAQIQALATFGRNVGVAFQVLNDVNNVVGVENATGRQVATDLRDRKRTIILEHSLDVATPPVRQRILELISSDAPLTDVQVGELRQIMLSLRSPEHAQGVAEKILSDAHSALEVLPRSQAVEILLAVANTDRFRKIVF